MRLVGKLALLLAAVLSIVLSASLWISYRMIKDRIEASQDSSLRARFAALAMRCGDAWGARFDRVCLGGLFYSIQNNEPSAFSNAFVMDEKAKILLHSNFLRKEFSSRGAAADSDVKREADTAARFVLRKDGKRFYGEPIVFNGKKVGTLVAVYLEDGLKRSLDENLGEIRHPLALACILASCLAVVLSIALARHLLAPLDAIAETAARVGEGDFRSRVPEGRKDELGLLAFKFNRMIDRLAELDELKNSFTAKVTHDLRNPLTAVQGRLKNLLAGYQGALTKAQTQEIQAAVDSGQMLADLIEHILEVTKLEAGRAEFDRTELDLESEFRSVQQLMSPRAQEFDVRLTYEITDGLAQVHADSQALQRVLMNLVSNALKFTPRNGEVLVKAGRSGSNEVRIGVTDTGIGIPQHRLAGLFQKFSQVPETRNKVRPAEGSGLGLLICKEIVEAHGGRIWAESQLMRGTTIYFTLPERLPMP